MNATGRRLIEAVLVMACVCSILLGFVSNAADEELLYSQYLRSLDAVRLESDIEANGFRILDHYLDVHHAQLGQLLLITAIHDTYHRVALFFAREDGTIAFKTENMASNLWLAGRAVQAARDVAGVAYRDLDGDGLRDIVIIAACKNQRGAYANEAYHVGDVLFQNESGFYRDYRVSDKINRFDMNKNIEAITRLVRDGISMEFLFTAETLDELLEEGFQPISSLRVTEHFERFGIVEVVPGFYNTVGVNYLIIYIADQHGRILWNFQPMHAYVNFYAIRDISFKDIDGDGNQDFTVLGLYVTTDEVGRYIILQDYNIYYQRAGYFLEDVDFKGGYACTEDDDITAITNRAASYWRGQP